MCYFMSCSRNCINNKLTICSLFHIVDIYITFDRNKQLKFIPLVGYNKIVPIGFLIGFGMLKNMFNCYDFRLKESVFNCIFDQPKLRISRVLLLKCLFNNILNFAPITILFIELSYKIIFKQLFNVYFILYSCYLILPSTKCIFNIFSSNCT